MHPNPSHQIRPSGLSLLAKPWALPAILALTALALPLRSLAQAPTFNAFISTPKGGEPWFQPASSTLGDFNGDGKLDSLVTDGGPNLRLMLGNGNGTFSVQNVSVPATNPGQIRAADFNGDGRLDAVLVSNGGSWGITVVLNTGNDINGVPQFTVTNYIPGAVQFRSVTVGDLDGDGDADFIIGAAFGQVAVFQNNGNGVFVVGHQTSIIGGGGPSVGSGVITDLNGDGRADYVVASSQSISTSVFIGNGDGTLQAPFAIASTAAFATAADVNGDGKPDLVEADGTSLRVYLNNGSGSFGAPALYTTGGAGPTSAAIADINGDGNVDAVVANSSSNNIGVLLGDGNGGFGPAAIFAANFVPVSVSVGDFNSDGKPDVGTVGFNDRTYGVLTNTTVFAPPAVTVFASGISTVIAWDPIFPAAAINPWQAEVKPVPTVGSSDPRWTNPHPASVFPTGTHPWEFIAPFDFAANWINAWSDIASRGPAGQSWTMYSTIVTGEGDFVLQFLADNASWIYIDGELVGFQDLNWQTNGTGRFTIHLTGAGPHELSFVIWDGGGAAGGKFRLETTASFQANNPGEELPPPPPPSDTTPPVIAAPANLTAEATSAAGAAVTFAATAVDDVDGPVAVLANPASGSTFPLGITTVHLMADDASGNVATAAFTVKVQDTTAPALTVPASLTAEATSAAGAAVSYPAATATDAVGVASLTHSAASGSTFALGTTIVTVSASDAAGNTSTGAFTVTVQDTIAPALSVPANVTAEATSAAGAAVTYPAATATDAVGVASLTYSAASGSTFALGATTVTVTASDAAGNTSTGTFTVTVQDTTAPVIASVTPSIRSIWPPNKKMVPVTVSVGATDAVGIASTQIVSVATNQPDKRTQWEITGPLTVNLLADRRGDDQDRIYTITVEVRDAAGNVSTQTTTVTVPHDQRDKDRENDGKDVDDDDDDHGDDDHGDDDDDKDDDDKKKDKKGGG